MRNESQKLKVVVGPIKRMSGVQVITSPYGMRTLEGIARMHRGIDLRCVRFLPGMGYVPQWANQDVIATEESVVERCGRDSYGNGYVVLKPLENIEYKELKYIHINHFLRVGQPLTKGTKIGKCIIGGSSKAIHLHFETWASHGNKITHVNPTIYLDAMNIPYRFK